MLYSGVQMKWWSRVCAGAVFATFAPMLLQAQDVMRITESGARGSCRCKVEPEHPAMARQVRVEGKVQIDVTIDPNGVVENVKVLHGNALLSNSAVSAIKKWKFTPFPGVGK